MARNAIHALLRQLGELSDNPAVPDTELLNAFLTTRDADAFGRLMRRHGPMVLNVCARVLRDSHQVEDVFQATFLLLAERPDAIRRPAALAAWLHGVAYRLARRVRQKLELPPRAAQAHVVDPAQDLHWRDMLAALDEELLVLPERYRVPLVLCYLEGRTRDEAARQLGWGIGSLRRRLEGGRRLLQARLTRRGFTLPAVLGAFLVTDTFRVPAGLHASTLSAAISWSANPALPGVVTTRVAALIKEGVALMAGSIAKKVAAFTLILGLLGTGAWVYRAVGQGSQFAVPTKDSDRPESPTSGQADALVREASELVLATSADELYALLDLAVLEARRGNTAAARRWFERGAKLIPAVPYRRSLLLSILAHRQADAGDRAAAEETLAEARRVAAQVSDKREQSDALRLVVEVRAEKLDLVQALAESKTIPMANYRFRPLKYIAIQRARAGDIAAARQTLQLLLDTKKELNYSPELFALTREPLQEIAAAQIRARNIQAARATLREMDEGVEQKRKMQQRQEQFGYWWQLQRTQVLSSFAVAQAKAGDQESARSTWVEAEQAAQMSGPGHLVCLATLTQAQAEASERAAAKKTVARLAKLVEPYFGCGSSYTSILTPVAAAQLAVGDWDAALRTMAEIKDGNERPELYGALAGAGQVARAVASARGLESADEKARAMIKIARAVLDLRSSLPPAVKAGTFRVSILGNSVAPGAQGKTSWPEPRQEFYEVTRAYEAACHEYSAVLQKARDKDERVRLEHDHRPKHAEFAARMLQLAGRYPNQDTALDALFWILEHAYDTEQAETARAMLRRQHLASRRLGLACLLPPAPKLHGETEPLLRTAMEKSPHAWVRAEARLALANLLKTKADFVRRLQRPLPPNHEQSYIGVFGRDYLQILRATDADELMKEAETLYERVLAELPDHVPVRCSESLGAVARGALNEIRRLAVGQVAPEISGMDLDGLPLRLSEQRGKVVVIVFWATWCGPCRAMLPHERDLVKRMEGKPFVLLGVNADDDPERLRKFIAEESLPCRSWADGTCGEPPPRRAEGPIVKSWNVHSWPTIYVIDHKGVIRHRLISDTELDEAAENTVQEAQAAR